jgi:hypothetical protein
MAMELKPQDILVLLKAATHPGRRWTYAGLGEALSMSASEVHASVRRSALCGLVVVRGKGDWSPLLPAMLEFAEHGIRYVWPSATGATKRGIPTSFGAAPLNAHINSAPGEAPVWPHPQGSAKGPSLSPIYKSAPAAALADPALHRCLALLDALRSGRVRERTIAMQLLREELSGRDATE